MRIGLLTEGGYPYATGESRFWCDRLVRGLARHEFDIYALSRSADQEEQGWLELPAQVERVRTASLSSSEAEFRTAYGRLDGRCGGRGYGRRERRRFDAHFGELIGAVCGSEGDRAGAGAGTGADAGTGAGATRARTAAERFCTGLYGLAELAREKGGLHTVLRSERTVRALESACRAPGAPRVVQTAKVSDYLVFADLLERTLRPLSLDWYDAGEGGLGDVDLCHAASGGAAALPGLLAKRFFGVPLLVTEYGVQLRAHYLAAQEADLSAPVRTLLAAFHGLLAAEVYAQAAVITPGNAHARRWQERCGADRAKLRTVYPGMEAARFAEVGESDGAGADGTLVWVGRVEPAKDLVALLHAFGEVRKAEPDARLRIIAAPLAEDDGTGRAYLAHCRALASHLFPDEARGAYEAGESPVSFEEIGGPEAPGLADAYAAGSVVVLSSVVEGFPIGLVEAMFCGRATVSTDVGAVVEVIGGTGLVVPPRNPRALADACLALLRDPERRARLGAAGRARALELFTVEQNLAAFRSIYLELVSHTPVRREAVDGDPLPFELAAEAYVPGAWAGVSVGAGHRAGHGAGHPSEAAFGRDGTVALPAVERRVPDLAAYAHQERAHQKQAHQKQAHQESGRAEVIGTLAVVVGPEPELPLPEHPSDPEERMAGVDTRMTGLDEQMSGLGVRMTGLEWRVADLGEQLSAFDARMSGLPTPVPQTRSGSTTRPTPSDTTDPVREVRP